MMDHCQVCFLPAHLADRQIAPLCEHHLVHRSIRRCDEPFNKLTVCFRCHASHHDRVAGWPELSLGNMLWAKRDTEPRGWKPKKLRELYCKALPRLEPLPEEYLAERRKYRPCLLPVF